MVIRYFVLFAIYFLPICTLAQRLGKSNTFTADTAKISHLNNIAYKTRLENPQKALEYAYEALLLAQKIHFKNGEAEAYRVKGIANTYLDHNESAINNYFFALNIFQHENNLIGEARVYNNIGNQYSEINPEKSLTYFNKALNVAIKLKSMQLQAAVYGNIGNVYEQKNIIKKLYRIIRKAFYGSKSWQILPVKFNLCKI